MSTFSITPFYRLLLILFAVLNSVAVFGQFIGMPKPANAESDSNVVELIYSRKVKGVESSEGQYLYLEGDVHFKQKTMHLWCDTAHRYPEKRIMAYGNVQMVQDDSIRIFSDSLFYNGNERKARLAGEVVLQDSSMTMFTDDLFYDLNTKIATYPSGALIVTDSAQLVSKSGSYDANTNIAYFVDSVRLTDPNYKLFADSLAFDTEKEIAYFIGPTFIFDNENMVYCEDGFFDSRKDYAELRKNAYYLKRNEEGFKKAAADTIIYKGAEKKYLLIGNAVYTDNDKEVRADTIVRVEESDQFFFYGNPKFRSLDTTSNRSIDAKHSYYDAKTETIIFRENVRVVDKSQILTADSLDYSQLKHFGVARGNVVWEDTVSNLKIFCGEAEYNDSTNFFLAKNNPVLLSIMEQDSFWLSADTLRAEPDSRDKERKIFYAYNGVRMYKKDLQGLCDSLVYNEVDSMFFFYNDPVLWVNSVQFTADTIQAIMKEGKMHRINLYKNSLIVSSEEGTYFNQVKGRDMKGYFADNKLQNLDVKSNGEAIYYALDDQKSYLGVNDVDCSDMFLFFKDNTVERIKFTVEPKAVLYPMGQVNHDTLRLRGFEWLETQRPKSKTDVTDRSKLILRKAVNSSQ